jgi:molybdopterin-guanine dinucleotide biosynthesis protein A
MGFDKARADWRGQAMAAVVASALAEHAERVALVRRPSTDPRPLVDRWGAPWLVVAEPDRPDHHPLWGVAAALRAAGAGPVLVSACDLPEVPAWGLAALVEACPAVARDETGLVPVLMCLDARFADQALALAEAGAPARDLARGFTEVVFPCLRRVDRPEDLPAGSPPGGDPFPQALAPDPRAWAAEQVRRAARGIGPPWTG